MKDELCMVDICFLPLDVSGSVISKPGVGSFGLFHLSSPCSPVSVFRQGSCTGWECWILVGPFHLRRPQVSFLLLHQSHLIKLLTVA